MMFEYEHMTPELQAYLDLMGRKPKTQYVSKDGKHQPTPESTALYQKWASERDQTLQFVREELDRYHEAKKVWYCRDETVEREIEHKSPSGAYRLVVTYHPTGKGTWAYTKGRVYQGDTLLATVCRNYSSFLFAWVEGHENGNDYLVCGEDYQGQTLVNLSNGSKTSFLPKSAEQGHGFCWAGVSPSPNGKYLMVDGCYWACPFEVFLYDFSEPEKMPWTELLRGEPEAPGVDADSFKGWSDDGRCELGVRWEEVDLPGHPLHGKKLEDVTCEQMDEIEDYATAQNVPVDPNTGDRGWAEKWETYLVGPEAIVLKEKA